MSAETIPVNIHYLSYGQYTETYPNGYYDKRCGHRPLETVTVVKFPTHQLCGSGIVIISEDDQE